MHSKRLTRLLVLIAIAALLPLGVLTVSAQDATPTTTSTSSTTGTTSVSWVNVVKQVGPAVVTVVNEQSVGQFGNATSGGSSGTVQPVGSGTGFIIDSKGDVVTNWHVVNGGQKFKVVLADGTSRDATLVGFRRSQRPRRGSHLGQSSRDRLLGRLGGPPTR